MLTPEQLEAAARKLCEIRGIDPDERRENETKHDEFISTTVIFLAWEECADEIRAYLEIQEAIRSLPRPELNSFCVCGHSYLIHASRCLSLDCHCDLFTEGTGATIEANKTP